MKYAMVRSDGTVVEVRTYRDALEPGTFNDEAAAAKNGKPFLLPLIEAVVPQGQRVISRAYARAGSEIREVLTTEPTPPPAKVLTIEALADLLIANGANPLTRADVDGAKR